MNQSRENNIILDAPDKSKPPKNYKLLGYFSIGLLIVALLEKIMHYPYWEYLLIIGMSGMTTRSVLLFMQKPQPFFAWFYFLGRISLLAAAALYFGKFTYNTKIFYPSMILFFIGIVAVMIVGKKADEADAEDI